MDPQQSELFQYALEQLRRIYPGQYDNIELDTPLSKLINIGKYKRTKHDISDQKYHVSFTMGSLNQDNYDNDPSD